MKRKVLVGLFVCGLLLSMVISSMVAAAPAKPIELRFTMYFPTDSLQAKVGAEYYKEIEKRSNGQVKFT